MLHPAVLFGDGQRDVTPKFWLNNNMTDTTQQDDRKNPNICPALPITEIAELYGYTREYIHKLVRFGYLHSYKVTIRNRQYNMVFVASMNAWVRMQDNRNRAS